MQCTTTATINKAERYYRFIVSSLYQKQADTMTSLGKIFRLKMIHVWQYILQRRVSLVTALHLEQ